MKTYGCFRCLAKLPREHFPQGKRLVPVCWNCLYDQALVEDRRRAEREANRATKMVDGVLMHRCSGDSHEGERWLPWDQEHFYVARRDSNGSVLRLSWCCKACDSHRQSLRDHIMRANPETAPAWKEMRNAQQRKWRRLHREKCRRYEREWKERLRADPERYVAYLADQRITYKIRREAKGLPMRGGQKSATGAWRAAARNSVKTPQLPVEPLAFWLESLLAEDHRERAEIAEVMQVCERILWRVQRHEYPHVTTAVADALVWGYGRPVVVRSEIIKTTLVEWADSLPGNGTRLLRYLDRAEKVAHLADTLVSRVEDLYPELDEVGA